MAGQFSFNKPTTPVSGQGATAQSGVDQQHGIKPGTTVGQIKQEKSEKWRLDGNTQAYVNGNKVDDSYQLQAGEVLEFTRRTGEKG